MPADDRDDPMRLAGRRDPFAELDRWLAVERVDDAARERSRQRWLRQLAGEELSLVGILVDVAEQKRNCVLTTTAGRQRRGLVTAVGRDFCVVARDGGTQVFLPLTSIAVVRPDGHGAPDGGERSSGLYLTLTEALARLVAERPRVLASGHGDTSGIGGELRAVGRDAIEIVLDDTRTLAYLPIDSLSELTVTSA